MSKFKKNVILDFDGVINSYVSGWKGADVIPDEPVPGMREEIKRIREAGYNVVVVSSRCYQEGGVEAIKNWLNKYDIEVDDVTDEKPASVVIIDDRAICFNGDPRGLLEKIDNFKPWNKR